MAEILAAWRQAERMAREHAPGSEEWAAATTTADRLRTEYRALAAHQDAIENEPSWEFQSLHASQADGREG